MPATSINDLVYIDATGYHYGTYQDFLDWLVAKYKGIYGEDVYLEPDSQDGQFLGILAEAFFDTAAIGAATYNSFAPVTAQGTGLARLVKINGLTKRSASFSTVTLSIGGTSGTVINNGLAQDTLGQIWVLPSTVTIPGGGSIDVVAVAQQIGFVTADTGTVTTIFTPTVGWQTVTNAAAATPGDPVETDAQLRIRQALSTSLPAQTPFDATLAAVANVTGVTKVQGYENFTNSTDGNGIPAHAICVVTVGGAGADIAAAIVSKKTPGTNPVGNTGPIAVTDSRGMPLNIYYSEAVTATIGVTLNITALTGWSNNYLALIKAAVAAYESNLPIGSVVYYTSLFTVASLFGTPAAGTFVITSVAIGKNGGSRSAANIVLAQGENAENPVCSANTDITINVS